MDILSAFKYTPNETAKTMAQIYRRLNISKLTKIIEKIII